jgi:hypothetical protein
MLTMLSTRNKMWTRTYIRMYAYSMLGLTVTRSPPYLHGGFHEDGPHWSIMVGTRATRATCPVEKCFGTRIWEKTDMTVSVPFPSVHIRLGEDVFTSWTTAPFTPAVFSKILKNPFHSCTFNNREILSVNLMYFAKTSIRLLYDL